MSFSSTDREWRSLDSCLDGILSSLIASGPVLVTPPARELNFLGTDSNLTLSIKSFHSGTIFLLRSLSEDKPAGYSVTHCELPLPDVPSSNRPPTSEDES